VPVLAVTSPELVRMVAEESSGLFQGVVTKPFQPTRLKSSVLGLLGNSPGLKRMTKTITINKRKLAEEFPLKILLTEDTKANQDIATFLLKRLGYVPEFAVNGEEAVKAAMEKDFDIIFMDVQMPVMDGVEATRTIRAGLSADRKQPWIVALTANALKGDRERFIASGMNDYLSKPVNLDAFEGCFMNLFQERTKNGETIREVTAPEPADMLVRLFTDLWVKVREEDLSEFQHIAAVLAEEAGRLGQTDLATDFKGLGAWQMLPNEATADAWRVYLQQKLDTVQKA
jgi:CheY-like chemotaxis protein